MITNEHIANNAAELNKIVGERVKVIGPTGNFEAVLSDSAGFNLELFELIVDEGFKITFHARTVSAVFINTNTIFFIRNK